MIGIDSTFATTLEAYRLFFDALGKSLHIFPTQEFLESVVTKKVFEEMPIESEDESFIHGASLLQSWSEAQHGILNDERFHEVRIDATRLFAGAQTMAAPPWESVYFNKERMIFQKETLQVRAWYLRYGLQITQLNHEPEDHIGLELDFVAHLLKCTLEAFENGNKNQADELLHETYQFIAKHPLRWIHQWAKKVQETAATDYFLGIAFLVPAALDDLFNTLDMLLCTKDIAENPA